MTALSCRVCGTRSELSMYLGIADVLTPLCPTPECWLALRGLLGGSPKPLKVRIGDTPEVA